MRNREGFVLVTALAFVLLISIMMATAVTMITTELKISSNDRMVKQAFYISESGTEEARARFQETSSYRIEDTEKTNANWKRFIGPPDRTQSIGFDSSNSNHAWIDRVGTLDYTVLIEHKVNSAGQIVRWGDKDCETGMYDGIFNENICDGDPVYMVTSKGVKFSREKDTRIEMTVVPVPTILSVLYTKDKTVINGGTTYITGYDQCGAGAITGVAAYKSVIEPDANSRVYGDPNIYQNYPISLDTQAMVNEWSKYANLKYTGSNNIPNNWGDPTPFEAAIKNPDGSTNKNQATYFSNCNTRNIIYVNMNGGELKLGGTGNNSGGCGLLLVNGDLQLSGKFNWYGLIIVTGTIRFTGNGNKNITGSVLSGGNSDKVDDVIGGSNNIAYCSNAIRFIVYDRPVKILRWAEVK